MEDKKIIQFLSISVAILCVINAVLVFHSLGICPFSRKVFTGYLKGNGFFTDHLKDTQKGRRAQQTIDNRASFSIEAEDYSGRSTTEKGSWWEVDGATNRFKEGPKAGEIASSLNLFGGKNYMLALGEQIGDTAPTDFSYIGPTLDYKVSIKTGGQYALYLHWLGQNENTDSVYAYILDPNNNIVETPISYFLFHGRSALYNGKDVYRDWVWDNMGLKNRISCAYAGRADSAIWYISSPGIYTIRLALREPGTAIDALRFQTTDLYPLAVTNDYYGSSGQGLGNAGHGCSGCRILTGRSAQRTGNQEIFNSLHQRSGRQEIGISSYQQNGTQGTGRTIGCYGCKTGRQASASDSHPIRKVYQGILPKEIRGEGDNLLAAMSKDRAKGIQDIKLNTENEKDIYFWDEEGNLLERKYITCWPDGCDIQTVNYEPKRNTVIDGREYTVQDVREALYTETHGDYNTKWKSDHRVLVLEGKNIIAEYFRDPVTDLISTVLVYSNGKLSEQYFFIGREKKELRTSLENGVPSWNMPEDTKLGEILEHAAQGKRYILQRSIAEQGFVSQGTSEITGQPQGDENI